MSALVVAALLGAVVVGPELEHCRLAAPVFVSAKVGVVADRCGGIFRTTDGGDTWERITGKARPGVFEAHDSFEVGLALGDGSIVIGGYLGTRVLRSEDQGRTWKEVPLPSDQWLYALSSRGPNVWTCGSSGQLIHSGDSGRSWRRVEKAPTNQDDRCISLDFLDGKRGWIAGWYGSLWSTEDGGATWRRVALPTAFTPLKREERTLDRVLRVDDSLGFVSGPAGTLRTRDGGQTWEALTHAPEVALVPTKVGNVTVLATKESATRPLAQRIIDLSVPLAARGDGAAELGEEGLALLEPDGTRRVVGLNGPSLVAPPRPETMRRVSPTSYVASSGTAGFVSQDGAQTWRQLASLPGELAFGPMWIVGGRRIVTRSGAQHFRSDDLGRHWVEAESPLDARDLARALGETFADPVSCLEQSTGSLVLSAGEHGCFGGTTRTLRFSWDEDGGSLEVTVDPVENGEAVAKFLTGAQAKAARLQLHELVLRDEVPSGCWSTNSTQVRLDVTCSGGRQTVKLSTSDCGARALPPGVGGATRSGQPSGYARANGVMEWALSR